MNGQPAPDQPKRILVVRLGAMGDVIHAFWPVVFLRASFPEAKIGWVIEKRWSELLRLSPDAEPRSVEQPLVDTVHTVDTRAWRKTAFRAATWRDVVGKFSEIRRQRYDVAIDFQGAIKSSVFALLSGAPRRFGFAEPREKPAALLYTNAIHTRSRHVVDQNLELVASLAKREVSSSVRDSSLKLFPQGQQLEHWTTEKLRLLKIGCPFAVLNPGAGWGAKQWPPERYAEVARTLGAKGISSIINHGPGEENVARLVEQESAGFAIAAQFRISELIAITQRAALFIGGDTGPMHLAALQGIPVIAIFGPTDPARNGPYTEKRIVLRDPSSQTSHKRKKDTEPGLLNITAGQVIAAADKLLNAGVKP